MVQGQVQGRCFVSCFFTLCSLVDDRASETIPYSFPSRKKRKGKLFVDDCDKNSIYMHFLSICILKLIEQNTFNLFITDLQIN